MRPQYTHDPSLPLAWRAAQAFSVLVAVAVVVLLLVRPEVGLFVTWSVLIPVVPVLLLVAPQVWRNLCPIAVINQIPMTRGIGAGRRLSVRTQRLAHAIAAGLFYVIVPLRLTFFNEVGWALAAFVGVVLLVAALGGLAVTGKGGWCATFCPVLPVERMYGQTPLIKAPHAHCNTCTGCIRSCYDLIPERSIRQFLKPQGGGTSLLKSSTGVFAGAFPGFVMGYFTASYGSELGISVPHVWIFLLSALSLAVVSAVQRLTRAEATNATRVSAAIAMAVYYWFTVPASFAAAHRVLAVPEPGALGVTLVQGAFLGLIVAWFLVGVRRASTQFAFTHSA